MLNPGISVLCEVALRIGTRFCPAGGGAGRSYNRDCRRWFSPCLGLCTPGLGSVSFFFTSSWQAHSFGLSPRGKAREPQGLQDSGRG